MAPFQFAAELSDYKMLYNVFKAIAFKEFAIIHPMEEGLKITVEEMKCVETSAYIPANVFSSYNIDLSEDIKFKVSLKVLTECLHIYGDDGNPSLKLSYKASGAPLCLVIKHSDENITVDCKICTMDAEEFTELILADESVVNKVVVNAAPLFEVLSDLDQTSEEFHLNLSPDPPYFRIRANNFLGESVVDVPKNSDMVTIFQCRKASTSQYAFNYIKQILKVMSFASKVSISTGDTGLLGLQLVINTSDKQIYVEYYVTSLIGDD